MSFLTKKIRFLLLDSERSEDCFDFFFSVIKSFEAGAMYYRKRPILFSGGTTDLINALNTTKMNKEFNLNYTLFEKIFIDFTRFANFYPKTH